MSFSSPPLAGIRVLEFAGLAPGPYAGLLLADYGATVLRIDRPTGNTAGQSRATPVTTRDVLTRRKKSIALDLKSPAAIAFLKSLLPHVDVVIEPFRPGVLEKLGLDPENVMRKINPRLIVARMTGFRRDGKYSAMAGHDLNYLAVSGILSLLGRKGEKPLAPGNILADFAGGGAVCFMGILLALLARERAGSGQVVEANMVDGAASHATFPRVHLKTLMWGGERGTNILDGGAPFYDTYETKDGRYVAVAALEAQFFAALLKGLGLRAADLPGDRNDPSSWPALRVLFTEIFLSRARKEWEEIFDDTDACVTPVLTHAELEAAGYDQRPIVTLRSTPGFAISNAKAPPNSDGNADEAISAAKGQGQGVEGEGWSSSGLAPGQGGEEVLVDWLGWKRGKEYDVEAGGLVWRDRGKL